MKKIVVALLALFATPAFAQNLASPGFRCTPGVTAPASFAVGACNGGVGPCIGLWCPSSGPYANTLLWRNASGTDVPATLPTLSAGRFLTNDGTNLSWAIVGGGGLGNFTLSGNVEDLTGSGAMTVGSTNSTEVDINPGGGGTPALVVKPASAAATVITFNDGSSAATCGAGLGCLAYDNSLHAFKASVNAGAYAVLGSNGILGAYQAASSTAQNVITETAPLGAIVLRGQAGDPTSTLIFGVQSNDGSTVKYVDVLSNALNLTTVPNGGGTVAHLRLDNGSGVRLEYGARVDIGPNTIPLVANIANATYGGIQEQNSGNTSAGAVTSFANGTGKNVYVGCLSGSGVSGDICMDITADTSGTTINQLVCWSSADHVQTCAASAGVKNVAGVALTTTANGSTATILIHGLAKVNCTGSVAAGDIVTSSGTAGSVLTNNTPTIGTIVGRATETCSTTTVVMVDGG